MAFGATGELTARHVLQSGGLRFVDANVHCPYGEIDLVMRDGDYLVFVEVKTRQADDQGVPQEAVTARKLKHLVNTALWYCQDRDVSAPWRIDVVAVGPTGVEHIPNVTGA